MASPVSLRQEQKNLTHHRVLDAAVSVFAGKSVVGATMEDIAREAGVTRVTVYAHFPGKGEIVRALEERTYDVTDDVFADLAAIPEWSRATIRTWLDRAAARWREMAPTIRVLTAAGAGVVGDSETSRDRYVRAHERYLVMLADDRPRWRATTRGEARQRVLMAILQLESFLSAWIAAEWPLETDDPLDLLLDAICHLFGPALR